MRTNAESDTDSGEQVLVERAVGRAAPARGVIREYA